MKFENVLKASATALLFASQETQAVGFYDCETNLSPILSDASALALIKGVHELKEEKFSSECLEILLKRNFFDTASYLLENYYPSTQIDTEIIVKVVAADL